MELEKWHWKEERDMVEKASPYFTAANWPKFRLFLHLMPAELDCLFYFFFIELTDLVLHEKESNGIASFYC